MIFKCVKHEQKTKFSIENHWNPSDSDDGSQEEVEIIAVTVEISLTVLLLRVW